MKFKSKFGETMLWIESMQKMVMFENGYADVDSKEATEMRKMGYIEDSTNKTSSKKVETVENTEETEKKPEVKPIKPIKPKKVEDDSEINSEI